MRPQQLAALARLVPEIREHLPQVELPDSSQYNLAAEGWQRLHFYESLSAAIGKCRKPLLLFLDDMQWCDSDTFEWLNAMLISPAATGVLVLGTVRAEETDRAHAFARFMAGLRLSHLLLEIPLEPLNAEETAELARIESATPLASGNLEEIYRSTRGNPLFVVESVRAGLQSTRVHAVIAARLAQLTPAAYELTGLASVVGGPFSAELLEKATDWYEANVSQALDELWRRIIESRGAEYDFTHDRIREVACAELSPVRQRHLHRRIARSLAETHAAELDSYSGQIASHFEQAGMAEEASPISKQRNKHLQSVLIEAAKLAPRWNADLALLHDKELQRGNRNRATLAVARKMVAYLLAVDRRQTSFQGGKKQAPGSAEINTAAA